VFTQLIQVLMAYSFWGGSTKVISVVLAVSAVGVLAAIFQKASTEALRDDPGHPPVL
jgi:hypothetical protein